MMGSESIGYRMTVTLTMVGSVIWSIIPKVTDVVNLGLNHQ